MKVLQLVMPISFSAGAGFKKVLLLMWLCARLEKLGGPKEAGEILLHRFIAPEGSNKVANLVNAERRDDMGVVFYTLEFIVEGPAFSRHNVAVYATSGGELFSLNAQSPKALWPNVQNQFREMANSFRLLR
jgi:photosystem II oxygen-evolving enhancer protein 2